MDDVLRAAVRPRVIREQSREPVLLEELVAELAAEGETATLALYGPPGAGTTSALQHLQSVFGPESLIQFVHSEFPATQNPAWPTARIHFPINVMPVRTTRCSLAGWEQDEWIEYLLAVHRDRCASVIRRVQQDPFAFQLDGNPNAWSRILDRLAADDELDVKGALLQIIDHWLPKAEFRRAVGHRILSATIRRANEDQYDQITTDLNLCREQSRLLFIMAIRRLLACETAWARLQESRGRDMVRLAVHGNWPRELISDVGAMLVHSPAMQDKLRGWLTPRFRDAHPLIVSLLHAAQTSWRVPAAGLFSRWKKSLNLTGAILDGADCQDMTLRNCGMGDASFEQAQFARATLEKITAGYAKFAGANFRQATLSAFDATKASFIGADLAELRGKFVTFTLSDLSFADLTDAKIENSTFLRANLSGAVLHGAELSGCCFVDACLDEADFTDANLEFSNFSHRNLSVANFAGARFYRAVLQGSCLEGMSLPHASFESASLVGAEMTGSVMPGANFVRADLRAARLAEVEWELADLRNANLAGATFHMGSARSGLVGVSIPMYGSRTGFYTDELHEQDFKAPEEIRKANLRGADLRGATIDNVDFYLVDLRDALYDPEQEDQLRRTGAILFAHT